MRTELVKSADPPTRFGRFPVRNSNTCWEDLRVACLDFGKSKVPWFRLRSTDGSESEDLERVPAFSHSLRKFSGMKNGS